MDFTANEGSGLNSTGGSNPPVSATESPVPAGTGRLLCPFHRVHSIGRTTEKLLKSTRRASAPSSRAHSPGTSNASMDVYYGFPPSSIAVFEVPGEWALLAELGVLVELGLGVVGVFRHDFSFR